MNRILFASALLASCAAFAGVAHAGQVAALTGDSEITVIDTDGKMAAKKMKLTGVTGKVLGIDVRPSDKMLYALSDDGTVFTIDTASGKATMKSKLDTMLGKGVMASVDFNPVADRLRVIGSDGMNLRANVDDGKVTTDKPLNYAEADTMKPAKVMITAGAYTNSYAGTKETALYDIDGGAGTLVKQAPPNDGVLTTIGKIDAKDKVVAFDIESDGMGGNTAWIVAGGMIHKLDLATGKTMSPMALKSVSGVRDIAVLPKM